MWTQGKNGHHTVNREVNIPQTLHTHPFALAFPASRPVRNTYVSVVSKGAFTIASQLDQDVGLRRIIVRRRRTEHLTKYPVSSFPLAFKESEDGDF